MMRIPGKSLISRTIFLSGICMALCLCQAAGARVDSEKLVVPPADQTQIITLHDGTTLTGRITAVEADTVVFYSQVGTVPIPIEKIDDIKLVASSSFKGGKYWFENPNRTRLFFSPTGRMQKPGTGYFQDLLLFFPSVSFGITENISIGGGMSLFPGVDFDEQLYYVVPKFGIKASEMMSLSASVLILRIPQFDQDLVEEPKVAGILFGVGTFGSEDLNLTVGVGHGYVDDDVADKPAVLIGGEWRFARRLSFVTENWVFPEVDEPLITYGLRFFGESLSADLGFVTPGGDEAIIPGIPMVGFAWNF